MRSIHHITGGNGVKLHEYLFLFWFLTLPFGAKIGSVSIGFISVYPSFVLAVALFFLGLLSVKKWSRTAKLYTGFLGLWLLYSILQPKLIAGHYHDNWKFDVKSLGLQLTYAIAIIGTYYRVGAEKFMWLLKRGTVYFLGVLIVSGLAEYYFGTHLRGQYTDKFFEYYTVTQGFYVPLFIYDNVNDYLVYLLLMITLFLALWGKRVDTWKAVSLLLLAFLFASVGDARLAMILIAAMIVVLLLKESLPKIQTIRTSSLVMIGSGVVFLGITFLYNPLFIGPKYTKYNYTTSGEYRHLPYSLPSHGVSSGDSRKSLILNGVDFIKEQPVWGIGAGEFRERHASGHVKHNAGTVIGPHNYLMEIVTQYGIAGWIYFVFLGFLFLRAVRKYRMHRDNLWLLAFFPILGVCSLMPSGFLYLDIHWILIPVMILLLTESAVEAETVINE